MAVKILITGGTFDKEYNELNGNLQFKNTLMPELLRLGRCRLDIHIETLMLVDSLEMTQEHRKLIADSCKSCDENKIVITHGTDTICETARYLAGSALGTKCIVLTGAMIPIRFGSSDGLFNLGASLAYVQTLPAGVYIAMNGRFFDWNNVRKNKETGFFETLDKI